MAQDRKVQQFKKFGYRRKVYEFTGEYYSGAAGYYRAARNKDPYRAPIYHNSDGERIIDMEQVEWKRGQES